MFVTRLTSQDEILSLNVAYVEQCPVTHALPVHDIPNKLDMSVTPLVSHVEMCPYLGSVVVALESHSSTAPGSVVSSNGDRVGRDVGSSVGGHPLEPLLSVNMSVVVTAAETSQHRSRSKLDAE